MKFFFTIIILIFIIKSLNSQSLYDVFATPGLAVGQASGNIYIPGKGAFYFDTIEYSGALKRLVFRSTNNHQANYYTISGSKLYQSKDTLSDNILFDTNWQIGDTIKKGIFGNTRLVSKTTITLLNGEMRDRFNFEQIQQSWGFQKASFVPGLGHLEGGLFPWTSFEGGSYMVCAKLNGQDIYINPSGNVALLCDANLVCMHPYLRYEFSQVDKTFQMINKSKFTNQFTWEFGDGNTSLEVNPTHVYDKSGCYKITLTGKDLCPEKVNNKTESVAELCSEPAWVKDSFITDTYISARYKITDKIEIFQTRSGQYKTIDGGVTFQSLPQLETEGKPRQVVTYLWWNEMKGLALCDYQNAGVEQKSIFVTHDGGHSWTDHGPESYYIFGGDIRSDGYAWIACGQFNEFYYRTSDYGLNWEKIPLTNKTNLYSIQNVGGDTIYGIGTQGFSSSLKNVLIRSYDTGNTWNTVIHYNGTNIATNAFVTAQFGYAVSNKKLYKTTNGGLSYTLVPTFFNVVSFHIIDENNGLIKDDVGLTYYTNDSFLTYTTTNCKFGGVDLIGNLGDSFIYGTQSFIVDNKWISKSLILDLNKIGCKSEIDKDLDGSFADVDCDDNNPNVFPNNIEIQYNGINDDCNANTLDDDLDQDGFTLANDCNDQNNSINPNATEVPYNAIDDDCNANTLDDDLDQDGFTLANDCNDQNNSINPNAIEIAINGIDENCDGEDLISSSKDIEKQYFKLIPNIVLQGCNNVRLQCSQNCTGKLAIYNYLGQLVLIKNEDLNQSLDISMLPKGTYIVKFNSQNHTKNSTLTLIII